MLRKQNRLAELRPDELELLTIAAEGGGTGVAAALRDPTKVLPALATVLMALGIGAQSPASGDGRPGRSPSGAGTTRPPQDDAHRGYIA